MFDIDQVLRSMTFEFFGAGEHKIEMEKLLRLDNAVFLDVRAVPEVESVHLRLEHHIDVLHIPTNEIPDRIGEIPRDRTVGIFCSAGTRSAVVYAYLRSKGFENVRVALGNYDTITNLMLPGKLFNHIRKTEPEGKHHA